MRIALKETKLGLRNSSTRIPFRYGNACLTRCPQAVMEVTIEAGGRRHRGFSGDCLPPSWFDKTPGRSYRQQIQDMLQVIRLSEEVFLEEFCRPQHFFRGWLTAQERIHMLSGQVEMTPLLASFGVSMVERALMDATARAAGISFARAVRRNLYSIEPDQVHQQLSDVDLSDFLPAEPLSSVFVRHTVGLGDPLTQHDIGDSERLDDGFPQSLEHYVEQTGTRYFKIKVANQLEQDLHRLHAIARLVERHRGADYRVTLDGNEQYKQASEFDALVDAIRAAPGLEILWKNVLVIEQPLERSIALDARHTRGIRELGKHKPVIIDESDGTSDAFANAVELGYRGVSSKNCKGPVRSLLNAALIWDLNQQGASRDYVMTGEDLCSVGIVPVQADLCLIATLGLEHVERNGHHFHPGLAYLPAAEQQQALAAHADFYERKGSVVAPRLVDGRFQIASLQCVGFGFAVEPDLSAMQSPDEWKFDSLGLPA